MVNAGAVPVLVLCLLEPEMALKRIAASTLSDICKHTPELAHAVVDAGAIPHLAQLILSRDTKLKVFFFFFPVSRRIQVCIQSLDIFFLTCHEEKHLK